MSQPTFKVLTTFLEIIPSLKTPISTGVYDNGFWWIKFQIDIKHPLAWQVIQELSCVLNYLSISERQPTIFYPVSPAPYLNGGPSSFLSWIIEATDIEFKPEILKEWLEGRLPRPVDDMEQWNFED